MSNVTPAMLCGGEMYDYIQDGYLDGGPCTGVGSGTPACTSLANCCGQWDEIDAGGCSEIAAVGNQSACAKEFNGIVLLERHRLHAVTTWGAT
jgi:hypothetical protein